METPLSPLSSRPKRTRISYFAAAARSTGAVSRKGNRMKLINATAVDRKSGGAQWRDLRFRGPPLKGECPTSGKKWGIGLVSAEQTRLGKAGFRRQTQERVLA